MNWGVAMNAVISWWRNRGHQPPRLFEDMRALLSVAAAGLLIFLVLNKILLVVPPDQINQLIPPQVHLGRFGPEHLLAAVVGFYFGSRS